MLETIGRQSRGPAALTDKNRAVVERLDDPAFIDRLVNLPQKLMTAARAAKSTMTAASLARDAIAVEILLTCSMRIGNLVDLRLGETITRLGNAKDGRWVIDLAKEKVNYNQPMRFLLPPDTVKLLEEYLATWHAYPAGPGSPWLFPHKKGHAPRNWLSESLSRRAFRFVGARITAHQFRHLTAELYLREDPNGIGIVAQHLGHRDLNTTRRFYAREQTRLATTRYHAVLERTRNETGRTRRRRRSKPAGEPIGEPT